MQMESSVTGESRDPEGATAEHRPAASAQDGLATAVARMAACILADILDPVRLLGGPVACIFKHPTHLLSEDHTDMNI